MIIADASPYPAREKYRDASTGPESEPRNGPEP
jgi:hypothetical protein